jgi:cargo-transport protein YPP1
MAEGHPFQARAHFEEALMHYPNHPSAIVGLANILLDIYSEVLIPPPAISGILSPEGEPAGLTPSEQKALAARLKTSQVSSLSQGHSILPTTPLGLGGSPPTVSATTPAQPTIQPQVLHQTKAEDDKLAPPYKAESLPLVDRLSARDRAYGLLSGLTKLGSGWSYSEAWFALARAYEESGQLDKAKEALWWCVELEEGKGVRDWTNVGIGGYVL